MADILESGRLLRGPQKRYRNMGLMLALGIWIASLVRQWILHPRQMTGWHGPLVLTLVVAGSAALARMAGQKHRPPALLAAFAFCAFAVYRLVPADGMMMLPYAALWMLGASLSQRRLLQFFPLLLGGAAMALWPPGKGWDFYTFVQTGFSISAVLLLGRTVVGLRTSRDLQMRLSGELQQANEELRRRAEQAEELAILRERNRLARELHDTLGHALSTLTVQLEAMRRVAARQPGQLDGLLLEAQALSRQAMHDLRESLAGLRGQEGAPSLADQLRELAQIRATQAGWSLDLALDPLPLPTPTAHALLAIAREALFNTERHAQATRVRLCLTADSSILRLRIEDDGAGFDPGQTRPGHFGLAGMRERVQLLGGRLSVRSAAGQGVTIEVEIPLTAAPVEAGMP